MFVCDYNKALHQTRDARNYNSAEKQKRRCAKELLEASEKLLDDNEESSSVDPSFAADEAFSESSNVPSPDALLIPPWMNEPSL